MRAASSEPGFTEDRLPPRMPAMRARIAVGLAGIAARLFLDDAFEHALDEGHTGRLDRLQIAGCEQARLGRVEIGTAVGEQRIDRPTARPRAWNAHGGAVVAFEAMLTIGQIDERSMTVPSGRTVIGDGPADCRESTRARAALRGLQSEGRADDPDEAVRGPVMGAVDGV